MLQDAHDIERAKWDGMAGRERPDHALVVPDADFGAYCRRLSTMAGIDEFLGDLRDKEVLEYGCGLGTMTTLLAKSGARVSAFDISPVSIAVARRRAELHGVDDRIEFVVSEAERLPYDAGRFEVAVGRAVLHHLEVAQAGPELHRVLCDGGKAAFSEPMGTNPVIAFARDHLPYPGKNPRGADVPLSYEAIAAWERPFSEANHREVQLLAALERVLGLETMAPLDRADDWLLERFPGLRRLCRYVVLRTVK
jgi:2-polyprenyl-3-methyl-5-hydroxy-6-metoxy-1,4-benzoquinol methylase